MQVKIKKLHPDAVIPTYGSADATCFDLYAAESVSGAFQVMVDTGLAVEFPAGHGLFIKPRSGMKVKQHLEAFAGTVDPDYRNSVKVILSGESWISVTKGDRIAQGMVLPVPKCEFVEVEELSDTARGVGGFGSTGK